MKVEVASLIVVVLMVFVDVKQHLMEKAVWFRAQELCKSRPALSPPSLTVRTVSVDVKQH